MRKNTFRKRGGKRGGSRKKVILEKISKKPIKNPMRNATFTIMTFNVESWLNFIKPSDSADKTDAIKNSFRDFLQSDSNETSNTKWKQLKTICSNVDVLCLQEDALLGPEGVKDQPQPNFIETIGHLDMVASCKSHPYRWPDTVGLYNPGSKLSNSIYSRFPAEVGRLSVPAQLTLDKVQTINSEGLDHSRCWALAEIKFSNKRVKIATIHLSGGRFDDIKSLEDNNYVVKIRQIVELIRLEKPDIICGDLNTKLKPPAGEDKYFLETILRDRADTHGRIQDWRVFYNSIYDYILYQKPLPEISVHDKWYIWMYGLDFVFKDPVLAQRLQSFPYKAAENNRDTTIFGGIVDMIYYNPQRLNCIQSSVVDGVISPGKRILSDHAPVKATFH